MTAIATPWKLWTSNQRIEAIHRRGMQEHGGAEVHVHPTDCVDGALGAAYNAEMYLEGRRHGKPGLSFAAHLLLYLIQRHCFLDGNKRVAWAAPMDALASIGLGIEATQDEAFAFVHDVIAHRVNTGEEIAEWLAARLIALPDKLRPGPASN